MNRHFLTKTYNCAVNSEQMLSHDLDPWEQKLDKLTLRGSKSDFSKQKTIHFLHGVGFSSETYLPLLKPFDSQYNLIMQNLQGHGLSDTGTEFIGFEQSLVYAYQVIKQQIPASHSSQVIGIGHSLGGLITLILASRYPYLFSELILLDPVLFPTSYLFKMKAINFMGLQSLHPLARKARQRRNVWKSPTEAYTYFKDKHFFKDWSQQALEYYLVFNLQQIGEDWQLCCPPNLEAQYFLDSPNKMWNHVRNLKTKTTIIYGSKSYSWIPHVANRARKISSYIKPIQIEGNHFFMLEEVKNTQSILKQLI